MDCSSSSQSSRKTWPRIHWANKLIRFSHFPYLHISSQSRNPVPGLCQAPRLDWPEALPLDSAKSPALGTRQPFKKGWTLNFLVRRGRVPRSKGLGLLDKLAVFGKDLAAG